MGYFENLLDIPKQLGYCERMTQENTVTAGARTQTRWITIGNAIYLENSEICIGEVYPLASKRVRRLIEVAPELLDQLKTLLAKWESLDESEPVPDALNDTDEWSWDDVRSLVAKVEGK